MQHGFGILKISEWIVKFAYANLLWIFFSFLGGIFFGIFPATMAMFAVARRWLSGEIDEALFPLFWKFYKKDFLKSNLLGFILFAVGLTLYIDFQLFYQPGSSGFQPLHYALLIVTSLYFLTLLYAFPVFVHYELSVLQVLKTAFLIMIVSPLSTLMMIAGSVIIFITVWNFPGFLPLFFISLLAFLIMWSAHLSFINIDRKNQLRKNQHAS